MEELDRLLRQGRYASRGEAVQAAVHLLSGREKWTRLARELAKIDRNEEMRMAEG